jgi:hypothetical protein
MEDEPNLNIALRSIDGVNSMGEDQAGSKIDTVEVCTIPVVPDLTANELINVFSGHARLSPSYRCAHRHLSLVTPGQSRGW